MMMFENYKNKQMKKILECQKNNIESIRDFIGDDDPSFLFYVLGDKLGYLLDSDPSKILSKEGFERRQKINKIIKKIGPMFLHSQQIIENRKALINPNSTEQDDKVFLPEEPVIWASNHGFRDDALASVLAAHRNAYFIFGSLPQFYNTIDGVTAWLNGSIMINRKNQLSRQTLISKCNYALDLGIDLLLYPEGVWNKSPNDLSLKFWPGIYRIAKEKNTKIIPIVHYKREPYSLSKSDIIHTVVDDAVDISNMSEKQALTHLRDIFATWSYLMMERYGKSTRETEVNGYEDSKQAWETRLKQLLDTADRYDSEIEVKANYVDSKEEELIETWDDIANINNININNVGLVNDAMIRARTMKDNNFQRRF